VSYSTEETNYYAVNIVDLSSLKPVELLLVQGKISSREIVQIEKNKIDGSAVLLRSTIKNDYTSSFKERQNSQLRATCELLWKFSRVRSYYSKNGKKFYRLKF
jgi:hypothetical protein